ncbi:ECF RNA polymerase sigma factor SigK [Rathayibacter soli]|uniref:ECF RNA polymerase sigma factor SigK n=1 Tax=Rathayibacter soli TaxID=3144168 RepID=UPI0027E3D689|nr:ECF RNA polymerase sigma factor SigK [Glaciibacter superstes]
MLVTVRSETIGSADDADAPPTSADGLLLRTAQGDQAAFGELYDRLAARVLGTIRRLLIDPAQSEEVAQEVFLEVWQSAARFEPNKGGAATWVLTMATRRAIDRIRSAQASRDRDTRIGIRDFHAVSDEVAQTVEIRIERERVGAAMEQLTDTQRQAISLAYDGEYTHSEIAQLLGIPIGTVKTRLRDGMIRLRNELGVAP